MKLRLLWLALVVLATVVLVRVWMVVPHARRTVADSSAALQQPAPQDPKRTAAQASSLLEPGGIRVTNPAVAAQLAKLLDESLPLAARSQAARALVQSGDGQGIAALKLALAATAPVVRALIAEELGESQRTEAETILRELIHGDDETTARGAVRGMALRGDAEAAQALDEVLFDDGQPLSVRTEAALNLGNMPVPEAVSSLFRAAAEIPDETIIENVLEGLGKRQFTETEDFFRNYLESPNLPVDSKIAALEALRSAQGEVAPLLLQYAADANAEVRAAAAWALSSTELTATIGPQLTELLKKEPNPEVRTRLYEALANQPAFEVAPVVELVRKETDPGARLAALNLWAAGCRVTAAEDDAARFDQGAVPELKGLALNSEDAQSRLSAVMSLRRAATLGARTALVQLAQQAADPRVVEAAQAATRPR